MTPAFARTRRAATRSAFDWPALLRAGLRTLRLQPSEFWALTPGELSLLLSAEAHPLPMGRARFLELTDLHPDRITP